MTSKTAPGSGPCDAWGSLGFGIGLRRELAEELLRSPRSVDWLEMTPESWGRGGRDRWLLDACAERWPIVPHGVSASIGGPDPLSTEVLGMLGGAVRQLRAPFLSDHIAFSRAGGHNLYEQLPLPFSEEAALHVAARAAMAQDRLGVPLVLENIAYYAVMPGSTLDEAGFLATLFEAAGVGLLLDVNNVYINAVNHGHDPLAAVDRLPIASVRAIHLGGHSREPDRLVDTHADKVSEAVWELYARVLARAGRLIPTLVEWDRAIPSLDRVLDELDRARVLARWALGERAEGGRPHAAR
jgi:uncharacterized protein